MIEVKQKVLVRDYMGRLFPGKVVNINEYREPSMKYAVDIGADDLVFVGQKDIIPYKSEGEK